MTFTDDLDQVRDLAATIAADSKLVHSSVETPDLTTMLKKLAEAGLTDIARESDDTDSIEILAATIGAQVGLAHAGILYPTADFDLYPITLTVGTELESALPLHTLLVPWTAIDQAQPIAWATHAEAVLTYRATDDGVEIAVITGIDTAESIVSIDGSPAARITATSTLNWVNAPTPAWEWITAVRHTTALAVSAAQLSEIVEMSVRYTTERTQFGRPVGKFQAVQKLVAECAANSEMVASAAASSLQHLSAGRPIDAAAKLEIVAGCLTAFDAVEIVVRNSHQALGAIGTTLEHPLQTYTRGVLQTRRQMDSYEDLLSSLSTLATSDDNTTWEMIAS